MENKFLGTGEKGYHPLRKIKVVLNGLRFAVLHDFSVLYKVILSILVFIPVLLIDSSIIDISMIIFATGLMIAAELFNTAIEAICDFMETDYNEKIGIIKDISAAATGVIIFVWFVVLMIEVVNIYRHFFY